MCELRVIHEQLLVACDVGGIKLRKQLQHPVQRLRLQLARPQPP